MCSYKLCILMTALFAINLHYAAFGGKVKVIELSNGWNLRNQNGTIDINVGKIPSGVYTALAELYGDVLHSYNDVNLRWIAYDNWTYTNSFSVKFEDYQEGVNVNLTLHGVDTVAFVRLNNKFVWKMDNMFARSSFNILPYLQDDNILEIEIISPVHETKRRAAALEAKNTPAPPDCPYKEFNGECHRNLLRKIQSSFGTDCSLAAPSMGIWKSVALEFYEIAIMRDVDVALRKNDTHWVLDIRVFLSTGLLQNFFADLTFIAADLLEQPVIMKRISVSYLSPIIEFKQEIPLEKVELWWPNGYGNQKLYPLFFSANCWQSEDGPTLRANTVSHRSLKIGFRTIELVEEKMENGGTSFFFKVNGVEIFAKGANILPMHALPELTNDGDKMRHLLESAKEAHMNFLRIWAGGIYESDHFYGLTDYYGLLVWQDMPFTSATYPITDEFVEAVRLETVHNAKRLAYHPSLAMIVTNDEVELDLDKNKYNTDFEYDRFADEFRQLFIGTVKYELNIISRSDFSPRPGPMTSTPSNGMKKKELSEKPQHTHYGDIHFYDDVNDSWNPDLYTRPRFVTEYGFQSLPALAAWGRVLNSDDDLLELIAHRQHHPTASANVEAQVRRHLPLPAKDDENFMEALIYLSQVSQAMSTKVATEVYRSSRYSENRTMGALIWQLNDVWVAPTRSMIDYYGNYKLLYYWARDFFAPETIVALYDSQKNALSVTLVHDYNYDNGKVFEVNMNIYLWSDIYPKQSKETWQPKVYGNDKIMNIQYPMDTIFHDQFTVNNSFLEFTLSSNKKIVSRTFFLPGNITQIEGLKNPKLHYDISWKYCEEQVSYTIIIRVSHPALFVYIEIEHPDVEKYKLSDNGFIQIEPVKAVHVEIQHTSKCINLVNWNVKIKTVNQYMTN